MTRAEMRVELLGQHSRIREHVDAVYHALAELAFGDPSTSDVDAMSVRMGLAVLAEAVRIHNRREDELLGPLLGTIDAWGPERAAIMRDEHRHERADVQAALVAASLESGAIVSADVAGLLARLLERLSHEEVALLTDDVLRDDCICLESGA
jgi:hypothetical protein